MITVDNISLNKDGRDIFSKLSLKIKRGDHILIKGPSGAGKSTLLKAILMFEPLTAGCILNDGKEVTEHTVDQLRHNTVYIGQKAPHFDGKVVDFLQLPFSYKANADLAKPSSTHIEELCQHFTFPTSPLERNYNSLSGGEQQRISIIQALLVDKSSYFLDEVTASLDPINSTKVVKYLCQLKNKTLVVVSHDQEWQDALSRVVTIENGQIKEV